MSKGARPSLLSLSPGLALVASALLVARLCAGWLGVSPLVVAVLLGVVATNLRLLSAWSRPGLGVAAKRLLRVGIVLLGFRLSLDEVARLGGPALLVVVGVVALTFLGTRWLGPRIGVSPALSLLVATGFSICGASAVAAMNGVVEADDEEVAMAVALVTLCGSLAILLLPPLGALLSLEGAVFGRFVGASVHDVAQVVATAAPAGSKALEAAVVVKLTRVALLAPLIAAVVLAERRRRGRQPSLGPSFGRVRPRVLPLFVVGFLVAAGLRSVGEVPGAWLASIHAAEGAFLTCALFALGAGVDLATLRRIGARPLVLGLAAWLLIAVASYAGVAVLN